MAASVEHLESEFYSKKFCFSYSSLNKLLWNPAVFYQMYVIGLKEEKLDSHLVQGKVIHALLLEETKFNDQFIISPDTLPNGNLRTVVDRVFAHYTANKDSYAAIGVTGLNQLSNEILDAMKEINYHQSLKTDQQRLDKVLVNEAFNYWNFLMLKGNKTLIDQETYDFCKGAVDIVKANPKICKLIACAQTEFDNLEVYNEVTLEVGIPSKPYGLKGIIDNVVINHDEKVIYINDLKTSSKDLKDWPESLEFYSYWLQAAIYVTLVTMHHAALVDRGYDVKFHFVVIDRTFQTYAFPVSEPTLSGWIDRLRESLDIADWHYINKSYELPYQFAQGLVTL